MTIPIALQLYTVRDHLAADFPGTLAALAEMGYRNVEGYGVYPLPDAQVRELLDGLGLGMTSMHAPRAGLKDDAGPWLERARTFGCRQISVSMPRADYREDDVVRMGAEFDALGATVNAAGLDFAFHNHAHEFKQLDSGRRIFDLLVERCDPKLVKLQLDVYWVKFGGEDPLALFRRLATRTPTLHIKDMAANRRQTYGEQTGGAMAEVGAGVIDFRALADAAQELRPSDPPVFIIEQDEGFAESSLASARLSLANLTSRLA